MTKTKIEWADEVWNPVTGCSKVSQGCKNCYAERIYERFHPGQKFTDVHMIPGRLEEPLHWRKPRRVFVNSMSDLFHSDIPKPFIDQIFDVMHQAYNHTFLILTKRVQYMSWYIAQRRLSGKQLVLPNVWLGVSCEDQATADERIPLLLQTPAAVRFVSVEPMLESVDLVRSMGEPDGEDWDFVNYMQDANDDIEPEDYIEECEEECDWVNYGHELVHSSEHKEWLAWRKYRARVQKLSRLLNWVICGGESGPKARPLHPDWARRLRDQCQVAGVPFFFKQWGEWYPNNQVWTLDQPIHGDIHYWEPGESKFHSRRIGKKAAGRVLDGMTWAESPGPYGDELPSED